ncbi:hypothetical protein VP01_1606g2 [Puccinia sorghi]|uniref:HAT C-terminal dimerisation domain-containing protein n=1 Tax=Puccinia sorghi TaxID=27349 RepID=A0A0L6VH72_9BASI|nr:hypothetical protein VP01_1606g2 [Puccinia sorghi]
MVFIEPSTFCQFFSIENSTGWQKAIDDELDNIENHFIWIDPFENPNEYFNLTWSSSQSQQLHLLLKNLRNTSSFKNFLHTFVHPPDFFETFTPTGKFPSLLALLVLEIDLKLPIFQRYFQGSRKTAPYLKLNKSLYRLKQDPNDGKKLLHIFKCQCLLLFGDRMSMRKFFQQDSPILLLMRQTLFWPSLIRKGLEILKLENFFPVWKPLTPLEQLHTASEEDDRHSCSVHTLSIQSTNRSHPLGIGGALLEISNRHESKILRIGSLAFCKSFPMLWKSKKQKNITMIADSLAKAVPHSSINKIQDKCLSIISSTTKEDCANRPNAGAFVLANYYQTIKDLKNKEKQRARGLCQKNRQLSNTSCKGSKEPFYMVEVMLFLFIRPLEDISCLFSKDYLASSASSCAAERIFSSEANVGSSFCGILKPQTIERYVSSHMWLKQGIQVTGKFEKAQSFSIITLISLRKLLKNNLFFIFYLSSFTFCTLQKKNVQYIHTFCQFSSFYLIYFFK